MIIHLDSTFRNVQLYPQPSEFEIDFNGQPAVNNKVRDVRSQYVTADYAQSSFQWIGDTTLEGISTRPNDALKIMYIPINPTTCIIFEPDTRVTLLENDYFVGLQFFDQVTKLSANINTYTQTLLRITLDAPIFQEYFGMVSPLELQRSLSSRFMAREAYLVNPTGTAGNNLLILGSTSLIPESPTEVALARGLNTNLWVQNVSKEWTTKITRIIGQYRTVLLADFPSYDANDYFIVWRVPNAYAYTSHRLFISGIWQFSIVSSSPGFHTGEFLESKTDEEQAVRFRVDVVSPCGEVLEMTCHQPGSNKHVSEHIHLYRLQDGLDGPCVLVRVNNVANGIIIDRFPCKLTPDSLIGILNPLNFQLVYFSILSFTQVLLYLDILSEEARLLNVVLPKDRFPFFIIPFSTLFPTIQAPIVPYQNATCFEVRICSISLPNLPVCGFNVLLADFPYIFVTLMNTNGPNSENYGTIISNNPNSASTTFVCPIANIRNPNIIKFVVVWSAQRAVFKFTPRNSLKFRVTLPNGSLLRYTNTAIPYISTCISDTNSGCLSINEPLNTTNNQNAIKVYALELSNLISATFSFRPLSSGQPTSCE